MATQSSRLRLTRDQLATFLKDHEQIRQFENLFSIVETIAPDVVNEVSIAAASAAAAAASAISEIESVQQDAAVNAAIVEGKANLALAELDRIASALELLALATVNRGVRMGEIHDALVSDPVAAGSLMIYDATLGAWKNANLTQGANVTITDSDGAIEIAAGAGSGLSFSSTTVSLGANPVTDGKFSIAGVGMTIGKPVIVIDSAGPGGALDDDKVLAYGVVTSAINIDVYWNSGLIGVAGDHTFKYAVGA